MSYLQRQLHAWLARGDYASLAEASSGFAARLRDVGPATQLSLGDGDVRISQVVLNPADSFSMQLPSGYDTSKRLAGVFAVQGVLKVVTVSPELTATSTALLKGAAGARGIWSFQHRVTSITISVPASYASDVTVEFALWELPDLTLPASYREGARTLGYV